MDKQIEEMAKEICPLYKKEKEAGQECGGDLECDFDCIQYEICKDLFEKGYRKASDVAKQVLDEVVEACFVRGDDEYIEIYRDEWEALEKKYGNENWCGKESEG